MSMEASSSGAARSSGVVADLPMQPPIEAAADVVGDPAKYPLWWLDVDGAAYQTIMNVNEHTVAALTWLHETTGLPWWATIATSSLLVRLAFMPLNVYALRNTSRFFDARGDVAQLSRAYSHAQQALGAAATQGEKLRYFRVYVSGVRAALRKVNCYPYRSFLMPVLQLPPLLAVILGARHAVLTGDESFETGGMLWFTDLTVGDPSYALPAIAVTMSYLTLEVAFGLPKDKDKGHVVTTSLIGSDALTQRIKSGLQMWVMCTLPFVINLPAGVFVGWVSAATWSMLYMKSIRTPRVYSMLTGRAHATERQAEVDDLYDIRPAVAAAGSAAGAGGAVDAGGADDANGGDVEGESAQVWGLDVDSVGDVADDGHDAGKGADAADAQTDAEEGPGPSESTVVRS